ncbi:hypothetical protein [Shinella zoogloeoides]|uniref:hypothetical protein n=1 Tax=Shinella zoogloeoides TaxID=352475 RepID=UPI001F5ADB73|nr:hypothetical protein [Shinella zoogloeoides]
MNLTSKQVAVLLGLTERRIRQLADDGIAVRIAHGQYDGAKTIQNYVSSMTGPAKTRDEALDEAKEAARLKKEQADNWELKNAKLRNELLPVDEVVRVWSEQIAYVKSGLLSVVPRVRQRIALSNEDAEAIDKEIREAMTKLADGVDIYDADSDDPEEGDVDVPSSAEGAGFGVGGKGNPST